MGIKIKRILFVACVLIGLLLISFYCFYRYKNGRRTDPCTKPIINAFYDKKKDTSSFYAVVCSDYDDLGLEKGQQILVIRDEMDTSNITFSKNTKLRIVCGTVLDELEIVNIVASGEVLDADMPPELIDWRR